MESWLTQLQRLFLLPQQQVQYCMAGQMQPVSLHMLTPPQQTALQQGVAQLCLSADDADGSEMPSTRLLVLMFKRATDWPQVAALLEALPQVLELPLPAVSVLATGGYCLWFALSEPVSIEAGQHFLHYLQRHMPDTRVANHLACWPAPAGEEITPALPPTFDPESGKWSAFIDPGLGSMFAAEPGLEFPPGAARQAEVLSSLKPVSPKDWQRLQALMAAETAASPAPAEALVSNVVPVSEPSPTVPATLPGGLPNVGSGFSDPQAFLLAVINDAGASPEFRMRAAEALLPYFATR